MKHWLILKMFKFGVTIVVVSNVIFSGCSQKKKNESLKPASDSVSVSDTLKASVKNDTLIDSLVLSDTIKFSYENFSIDSLLKIMPSEVGDMELVALLGELPDVLAVTKRKDSDSTMDTFPIIKYAICTRSDGLVELLCKCGVNLNCTSSYPFSFEPLTQAAYNGTENIVRIMLSYGATMDQFVYDCESVLDLIYSNNPQIALMLLENDIKTDAFIQTLLIKYLNSDDYDSFVNLYEQYSIDPNLEYADGCKADAGGVQPLITIVASSGKLEYLKVLVNNRGDLNTFEEPDDGSMSGPRTCLDIAINNNFVDMMHYIISNGGMSYENENLPSH